MTNVQRMAALGAFRQQKRVFHLTANNLSNTNTPGFKKDVSVFHTFLGESLGRIESIPADGTKTQFQQGAIQKTGSELDLAIEGQGFFKVKTPQGYRYTRAGNFGINANQVLADSNGFPVMGTRNEISLKGQKIVIEKDGTVKVDGKNAGQIGLVSFSDLDYLAKEGHSLYRLEGSQTEMKALDSQILQGALESSNVNPVEEMVKLIDSFRTYESCLKIIQSQDELDEKAVNDLGRV